MDRLIGLHQYKIYHYHTLWEYQSSPNIMSIDPLFLSMCLSILCIGLHLTHLIRQVYRTANPLSIFFAAFFIGLHLILLIYLTDNPLLKENQIVRSLIHISTLGICHVMTSRYINQYHGLREYIFRFMQRWQHFINSSWFWSIDKKS